MVSTAFKVDLTEDELPSTGPYITFVGKIYSKPKQDDNDCAFGIDVNEYNNFNFTNKGRISFKAQIVYEAGAESRFKKLTPKLEVGRSVFVTGLLDLSDDDLPYVEAKEIDLLEGFSSNLTNTTPQSLFSRTQKFKNKTISIKKEKSDDRDHEKNNDSDSKSEASPIKYSSKRKNELADLSIQRLKKGKNKNNQEFEIDNQDESSQPIKFGGRKKKELATLKKTTKVTTRSQKQNEELVQEDNAEYNEE
jgi:hypothetical protein